MCRHEHFLKVAFVVGFPLGNTTTESKSFEAKQLVAFGVDELDMVINVGKLKDHKFDYVFNDIKQVVAEAHSTSSASSSSASSSSSGNNSKKNNNRVVVKVIIESGSLTKDEIVDACILSSFAGADF